MTMRTLSTAAVALATILLVAGSAPARAQAAGNAEDLCTPDVMRLCNDFIPDRDKITVCLRKKFRAVSKECRDAMRSYGGGGKGKGKHHRRHRKS